MDVNAARVCEGRDNGTTRLLDAVRAGDASRVKELVELGATVNQAKADGVTPLYLAVQERHAGITRYLLEGKAEVDACDEEGWSSLLVAARWGYAEEAEMLLAHGADKNKVYQFEDKWTALTAAAFYGHLGVVRVLMDRGASAEIGASPLVAATQRGEIETVKFLLGRNVRVNRRDEGGRLALVAAISRGYLPIAKTLIEGRANVDLCDVSCTLPIIKALRQGNEKAVKLLLAGGADMILIEPRTDHEVSRLIQASKRAYDEAVRGNVSFFVDAIEAGVLPAPPRQWFTELPALEYCQFMRWMRESEEDERACYAALYQGKKGLRLRECDDMRRLVASYLVAGRKPRSCRRQLLMKERDQFWETALD